MYRPLAAIVSLLALSPLAVACHCTSGGTCHCGDTCACVSDSPAAVDPTMAAPTASIVAAPAATPATIHVGVSNFQFSANATINAGDTVTWDWISGFHSVTSVSGSADPFNSGDKTSGSFSHTFLTPGTYNYYCDIHGFDNGNGTAGGMAATVTVLPVPEPAAAALAAAGLLLLNRRNKRTA